MKRLPVWIACFGLVLSLHLSASKASAATSVSVSLRVGDPYRGPDLVFQDEPDIVVVPGTRVYYIRDYDYDIYRYGSFWYYTYDGNWYRARRYGGPYAFVSYRTVPRAVMVVPVKYRRHWREAPGHAYGHYKQERREERRVERREERGRGHKH